jgi:hypothetical protein
MNEHGKFISDDQINACDAQMKGFLEY